MKNIKIAFDIDGTIISNTSGLGQEKLNIEIYNLMVLLSRMKNTEIIVWSGGGRDYAEQIVNKYGLTSYVSRCYGKYEYDESIDGRVDIAFDDEHAFSLADKNLIVRLK
jgi:hydroxymethylpyrimidine pyrophosphatase-like HAD family hydrolase